MRLKSSYHPIFFFAILVLWLTGTRQANAQQSVDNLVSTTFGGLRLNRATNTFDATGTIKNISPDVILLAPMWIVITSLSDPSVTLANTAGSTPDGLPYLTVPLDNNTLLPGQSVNNALLKFNNPKKVAFTYQLSVRAALTGTPAPAAPNIYITSPVNGSEFKTLTVTVSGTVDNNQAKVSVNGVKATVTGGRFTALNVPLTHDGAQILTAIATDNAGNTGQASTTVKLDTTPPTIAIDSPGSGFNTSDAVLSIAGTVSDTVSANPVVTVNGVPATVNNSSFIVMNLPLQIGLNTFTATATDDVGNTSSTQITITRVAQASFMLNIMGGQAQTALVKTTLPQPLIVKFTDATGAALAGRELIFQVSRGDGTLLSGGKTGRKLYVVTDANGLVGATFTLGSRSGAGNNRVAVMLEGGIPSVEFCATSYSGAPNSILPTPMTSQQVGVVNRPLASPFMANVFDAAGNPVAGAPVTFTVTAGGGNFNGQAAIVVPTGMDGVASAVLTLGPNTGTLNNTVTATFAGQTTPPLPFSASGRVAGAPGNTTFHGMVLDNLDKPLVNAHIFFDGMSQNTYTDAQGKFVLMGVIPGGQKIVVDSSTIQDAKGLKYNGLELNTNIISGVDNSLMTPIYLPPMPSDPKFSATITGTVTQAVVIPMPDVPEMTLTLLPGTVVSNANGPASPTNPITIINSRVNNNRVPMTLPNGTSFLLAGAVAPHGVFFNPPAVISVPNTGLAPGTIADIYNFDHSVGRYVSIGLATVTADGSHVVSNPGFGIPSTGWYGAGPPPPPTTDVESCPNLTEAQVKKDDEPDDFYENSPGEFIKGSTIVGRCLIASKTFVGNMIHWELHKVGIFFDTVVAGGTGSTMSYTVSDADTYRVVFYCDSNGNGKYDGSIFGAGEPSVQTEKFDVQEVKIQYLTVARHASITYSEIQVDAILAAATQLLQKRDIKDDRRCAVELRRSGNVDTFGDPNNISKAPPAIIQSSTDLDAVNAVSYDVKIVSSILWCGGQPVPGFEFDACTTGKSMIMRPPSAADAWAHEFGHRQGLNHDGGNSSADEDITFSHRIMFWRTADRKTVTKYESRAYRN